jgi:hypothetical protein
MNNEMQNEQNKSTQIILVNSQLTKIDKNLLFSSTNSFKHLNLIDLSQNQIKELDKTVFSDLIHLTHLWILDNEINAIHKDTFKGLINLSKLDLN